MRQGSLWWTCFSVTKPCLWPCGTPWTAVHLGSLYLTIPSRLLRLISLESCDTIQPSHLLSSSLTLLLSLHQGLLLAVDSLHQVAKYWRFSSSPCSEYSGLISFRIDWFDFLAAQGTLKSLLQHCSWKTAALWRSALFMVPTGHIHTWLLEEGELWLYRALSWK